ncbi:hypothetical protein D6817_04515 [Candidatus Pacearchaeota archaeon]|nr:MAG: hypothetical protein D6817_04515 [Candidatus Pacearchaeota archaeon]
MKKVRRVRELKEKKKVVEENAESESKEKERKERDKKEDFVRQEILDFESETWEDVTSKAPSRSSRDQEPGERSGENRESEQSPAPSLDEIATFQEDVQMELSTEASEGRGTLYAVFRSSSSAQTSARETERTRTTYLERTSTYVTQNAEGRAYASARSQFQGANPPAATEEWKGEGIVRHRFELIESPTTSPLSSQSKFELSLHIDAREQPLLERYDLREHYATEQAEEKERKRRFPF